MATKLSKEYNADAKNGLFSTGKQLVTVFATAEVAAADSDGDVYILARGIPLSAVLVGAVLPRGWSAVTGGTDYDLGVYKNTGTFDSPTWTVVDKDIFVDGKDMSSGLASSLDILTSVRSSSIGKLLGLSVEKESAEYAIALTANTVGSATVDLAFELKLAQSF